MDSVNKQPPFYVKTVRCANGERLPTLVNRSTGLPDMDATLWVTTTLRSKNLASASIEQALRSITTLYFVLRSRNIDLTKRLREGQFLTPADIEAISKAAKQTTASAATAYRIADCKTLKKTNSKIASLERTRMAATAKSEANYVEAGTVAIRLGNIRAFLTWRANRAILRSTVELRGQLIQLRDLVDQDLKSKTPAVTGRATQETRIGIDRKAQKELINIVMPSDQRNPWTGQFTRVRNQLIINLFLALGARRSELLGIQIKDINPRTQEVSILRRPDDIFDTRLNEPNTKTRDRVLPISSELYSLISNYLLLRHEIVRGNHAFLLVSKTGSPLSKSEVNRLFQELGQSLRMPNLTPHVLRHTFCETLAEDLFNTGHDENQILIYLRRLGGWSDTSKTPFRYIKRFTQEQAAKAGLAMQEKLFLNMGIHTYDCH